MKYENYEVLWEETGITFVRAVVYELIPYEKQNFLQRLFGITKEMVHDVVCIEHNGFPKRLFPSDMTVMSEAEYIEKVVKPAIKHYRMI